MIMLVFLFFFVFEAREILFNAFIEGYPVEQAQDLYVTEACQVLGNICVKNFSHFNAFVNSPITHLSLY
jgi:hypothetical protein